MLVYILKNRESIIIRKPVVEDADAMINLIKLADAENNFLAREPGEFKTTVECLDLSEIQDQTPGFLFL